MPYQNLTISRPISRNWSSQICRNVNHQLTHSLYQFCHNVNELSMICVIQKWLALAFPTLTRLPDSQLKRELELIPGLCQNPGRCSLAFFAHFSMVCKWFSSSCGSQNQDPVCPNIPRCLRIKVNGAHRFWHHWHRWQHRWSKSRVLDGRIYRSRFVPSFLCPGHNTLGCAMSHRRVYEKIVAEKWPCAMVFAPWTETECRAEPCRASGNFTQFVYWLWASGRRVIC